LGGSFVGIDSTRFQNTMTVRLHRGDLPDLSRYTDSVAIDTETMGLHPHRDRLCVVQLSNGDGSADVVQIPKDHGRNSADAPNLKALLANPKITKIFHFARFDLAALYNVFGVMPQPVYCTKIASRLTARGAARLRRLGRAASAWSARTPRCDAGARGPH